MILCATAGVGGNISGLTKEVEETTFPWKRRHLRDVSVSFHLASYAHRIVSSPAARRSSLEASCLQKTAHASRNLLLERKCDNATGFSIPYKVEVVSHPKKHEWIECFHKDLQAPVLFCLYPMSSSLFSSTKVVFRQTYGGLVVSANLCHSY